MPGDRHIATDIADDAPAGFGWECEVELDGIDFALEQRLDMGGRRLRRLHALQHHGSKRLRQALRRALQQRSANVQPRTELFARGQRLLHGLDPRQLAAAIPGGRHPRRDEQRQRLIAHQQCMHVSVNQARKHGPLREINDPAALRRRRTAASHRFDAIIVDQDP
jgi:hypothetical protein